MPVLYVFRTIFYYFPFCISYYVSLNYVGLEGVTLIQNCTATNSTATNCTATRVQLRFYKYIFNLKNSTPSAMIYGELGVMPLAVDIQTRMISFWAKLIQTEQDEIYKLSPFIYKIIYALHNDKVLKSQWVDNLKTLICSHGFGGIWYSQSFINIKWFTKACQNIKDVFIQDWFALIEISSSSNIYRLLKQNLSKVCTCL